MKIVDKLRNFDAAILPSDVVFNREGLKAVFDIVADTIESECPRWFKAKKFCCPDAVLYVDIRHIICVRQCEDDRTKWRLYFDDAMNNDFYVDSEIDELKQALGIED